MAAVEDASFGAPVERAVEQAVAARRHDLERLVRGRVDAALQELAGQLVNEQLARRCAACGGYPVLPHRTLCKPCHRARTRELHAARVARRNGSAPSDDEEPHQARARHDAPRGGVGPAESAPAAAAGEQVGEARERGMSAEELARRPSRANLRNVPADELEAWLRDAGLAEATPAGLLVPTPRGQELAAFLEP